MTPARALAQERAIEFTLLLAIPCVAAFLVVPDLIMRALFMRGKFTAEDAQAAAMTLAAYTIGLIPFVLMRSVVATFLARGDTATPVKAALTAAAVNIAFKVAFLYFTTLAQVGLALATSIGAWINFGLILWFGLRAGFISFDAAFRRAVVKLVLAGVALFAALWIAQWPVLAHDRGIARRHNWIALVLLALPRRARLWRRDPRPVRQGVARLVLADAQRGYAAFFRSSGTRVNVRGLPSRSTSISTGLPIRSPVSRRIRSSAPVTGSPSSAHDHVAGEQARTVRRAAGLGRRDGRGRALRQLRRKLQAARDGRLLRRDADVGAPHAAVPHQLAEHEVRGVGRDREADALRALDDRGVDADHLAARGDQRPAGIARVERRVGLDHVVDQPAGAGAQRAAERRDDAGRHGRFEAERIADRDHELAAPQPLGIAERRGRQRDRRVDPHQRKIGIGIVADHARGQAAAFRGHQLDARRAADHVAVGQYQPVGRHDDAGAGARRAPHCGRARHRSAPRPGRRGRPRR